MKETIEGWIARDEREKAIDSLAVYRGNPPERDSSDIGGYWSNRGDYMTLPKEMFPNQHWEDEPQKVIITIETIELDN